MTTTNKPQTQLGIDIIHLLEMSKLPVMKCNKRVIISMKYLWVAKEGEFPICSGQLLNLQNASVSFYPTYGNFLHVSFTFSFSRSSAAWGSTRSPWNLWLHSMFLYVILQGFLFSFFKFIYLFFATVPLQIVDWNLGPVKCCFMWKCVL